MGILFKRTSRHLTLVLLSTVISQAFLISAVSGRTWDDLYEGEHKVYGSEKEEKYPVNAFFAEKEEWENHYSCMFFWFYKEIDYPKYKSFRLIPFYYGLQSKIDNRERSLWFLLFYTRIDRDEKLTVNPFWYNHVNKDEYERSILYLFWWGEDKGYAKSSYKLFIPLTYYHSEKIDSAGIRESTRTAPLLLLWYSFSIKDVNKDYRVLEEKNWTLLHYYSTAYSERGNETTLFFPLIPITYHHTSPDGGHRNFLWLLDYSWTTGNGSDKIKRYWFIPVIFWKGGSDGYFHFLPPLYVDNRWESGEYYRHLFPLFIKWRMKEAEYSYSSGKGRDVNYESFMSLWYCSFKEYPAERGWEGEPERSTLFFPILPVYYTHSVINEGTHRNLLLFFDWHTDTKDNTDRFWLIPFWFDKEGDAGYRHVLPPIYMSVRFNTGEYHNHLIPFYLYQKNEGGDGFGEENHYYRSFMSLLFNLREEYKGDEKWNGKPERSTVWAPILPVYYAHSDINEGTHRNLLWLFDWHNDTKNNTDRFWLIPLWFDKQGDGGYRHVLPPLYMSFQYDNGEYYNHVLMLWFYKKSLYDYSNDAGGPSYTKSFYTPVFCLSREYRGEKKWDGVLYDKTLWAPFLPLLFYRSVNSEEGSHTNIIGLFDWRANKDGDLTRFWFIPLVFHGAGESGYRVYLPFYARPSGNTKDEGLSFSLLHYHSWSPETRIMWLGPCLNVLKPEEKNYFSMLLPVYLSWKSESSRAKFILPLYWSGGYKGYDLNIFLPLYLEYKSRKFSTTVNLLGISKSVACGTFSPELGFDVGTYKDRWYFDTDLSWLYDVFSISTRVSMKKPFAGKSEEDVSVTDFESRTDLPNTYTAIAEAETKEASQKPALSHKRDFNRENSDYFWGFRVLFGLGAYERAGSKKHLRLLPLSWFTWDEKSEDKLLTVPLFFISYKSEVDKVEYFALYVIVLPLFGYQKDKESYRYGYLLNAFWLEYDAGEKQKEYTVLWPIFNLYSSPKRFGWRLFPLLWYKKDYEENLTRNRLIIVPLLHYSRVERDRDDNITGRFIINPLCFSTRKKEGSIESGKTWFPIFLPLYYSSFNRTDYSGYARGGPVVSPSRVKYTTEEFTNLMMILYLSGEKTTAFEDGRKAKDSWFFLLGYYSHQSDDINESSFFFGMYKNAEYPESGKSVFKLLYGLYSSTSTAEESTTRLLPIYYNYTSREMDETYLLLGLYWHKDYKIKQDSDLYLLYGIFSLFNYRDYDYRQGKEGYKKSEVSVTEWWLIPLYYYKGISGVGDKKYSDSTNVFWLWYYHNQKEGDDKYSTTWWFPILPLIYRHSTGDEIHWNVIGIIDNKFSKDYARSFVLPLYYYSNDSGEKYLNIGLLFNWFGGKNGSYNEFWAIPLYYYQSDKRNNGNYSQATYTHVCPLYYKNYDERNAGGKTEYSSTIWFPVIPLLFYRYSSNTGTHTNVLGLFDIKDSEDYNRFFFLPFVYTTNDNGERHRNVLGLIDWKYNSDNTLARTVFFPLWLYYSGEESELYILPPLFYFGRSQNEKTNLILGIYSYSSPAYERQNFWYIFDHKKYIPEKRDSFSCFLGTIHFETSPNSIEWDLLYTLLMSYTGYRNSPDYEFGFLKVISTWERSGDYFQSSFLPVWYYESGKDSWSILSPIALSYLSKDTEGDFDLGLLGILYFRSNDIGAREDVRAVLGGTLYWERARPERGYHSVGSLWGILWDYETESETGFKKFSILKGLYKHVVLKGKTENVFLWVL